MERKGGIPALPTDQCRYFLSALSGFFKSMKEQPAYYAIIPASVRYDTSLPPNAKLLYGEITALCNKEGFCWASNKYFADLYGVSVWSISQWVKALTKNNHIQSEVNNQNTRKIFLQGDIEKSTGGYRKTQGGDIEKSIYNNTVNSTINNTNKTSEQSSQMDEDILLIDSENPMTENPSQEPDAENRHMAKSKKSKTHDEGYDIDPVLVAEVINQFIAVDPKNKTYFNNKAQRKASAFLIGEYGYEDVVKRITFLPKSNRAEFFPRIYTPVQLRDKWKSLEDAVITFKQKTEKHKVAF